MSKLAVPIELVRKYNVPGPRYTSYPPATQFSAELPFDLVADCIRKNNETERDLSLYFHIPFCEHFCWFCGCTSVRTTDRSMGSRYVETLAREIELVRPMLNPARKVVQLHLGGGSPTFLTPGQFERLGDIIHGAFTIAPSAEMGVEIDPRGLTAEHLKVLRKIGFNRASVGVQDNNPIVQKAVHRLQPRELTERVIGWAREEGFESINVDLIYGLPYQTPSSFEQTLDEMLALKPNRFAVFSYAHVPWIKPAQKLLKAESLPTPETKLALLKLTIEKLTSAGYVYIGMDHFALPDDELAVAQKTRTLQRNFQGYSTRAGADIYAFGMSSISAAGSAYWQNTKHLNVYQSKIDSGQLAYERGFILGHDDIIRREVIMQIMCNLVLDYAELTRKLGVPVKDYFAREIESMDDLESDGLVKRTSENLVVTDLGRLFVRVIAMRFDVYLAKARERRHAMTI